MTMKGLLEKKYRLSRNSSVEECLWSMPCWDEIPNTEKQA